MVCGARISQQEAELIWSEAVADTEARAEEMPTVESALHIMTRAFQRLRDLGWRDAIYCPKDGTAFEVIEAGSGGIHRCHYDGEWPDGRWWIEEGGDLWPSRPILYRPIAVTETRSKAPSKTTARPSPKTGNHHDRP